MCVGCLEGDYLDSLYALLLFEIDGESRALYKNKLMKKVTRACSLPFVIIYI